MARAQLMRARIESVNAPHCYDFMAHQGDIFEVPA
jgi:hypothetical protein